MFSRKNDVWAMNRKLRDSTYNNIYVRRIAWTVFSVLLLALGIATLSFVSKTLH